VLAADDLHKDVVIDLVLRKERMEQLKHLQGKTVQGFIQDISIFPFIVTMFSERQFVLLHQLLKLNPDTVLHFDATGTLK